MFCAPPLPIDWEGGWSPDKEGSTGGASSFLRLLYPSPLPFSFSSMVLPFFTPLTGSVLPEDKVFETRDKTKGLADQPVSHALSPLSLMSWGGPDQRRVKGGLEEQAKVCIHINTPLTTQEWPTVSSPFLHLFLKLDAAIRERPKG